MTQSASHQVYAPTSYLDWRIRIAALAAMLRALPADAIASRGDRVRAYRLAGVGDIEIEQLDAEACLSEHRRRLAFARPA